MSYKYSYKNRLAAKKRRPRSNIIVAVIVVLFVSIIIFAWLVVFRDKADAPSPNIDVQKSEAAEEPAYQSIDLQPTIDGWLSKYPSDYSIAIYDLQSGELIGQNNKDQKIFAASLYKIYVAYLSLLDFQTGQQNPEDILIAGQTKIQCVDKMIRSSDSPCGEAMMSEIGQITLNQRVLDMGITGTTFNGIQTTAADSALILKYIDEGRDLSKENTDFLLDSMLTQDSKFKRGLQSGAPEAKWQTKVGWNGDENYHDIGIMTLPDGRKFAVAILGQGSGSPEPIANFAATIFAALSANQTAN